MAPAHTPNMRAEVRQSDVADWAGEIRRSMPSLDHVERGIEYRVAIPALVCPRRCRSLHSGGVALQAAWEQQHAAGRRTQLLARTRLVQDRLSAHRQRPRDIA